MKKIEMWTDGACSGNPGKGGYCAILIYNGQEKIVAGNKKITTNNEMELKAIVEGIAALKENCEIDIYTDSAYISNAFNNNWIDKWINNGWRNSKKEEIANIELWKQLISTNHILNFIKVNGHSGILNNERCDKIARQKIMEL